MQNETQLTVQESMQFATYKRVFDENSLHDDAGEQSTKQGYDAFVTPQKPSSLFVTEQRTNQGYQEVPDTPMMPGFANNPVYV